MHEANDVLSFTSLKTVRMHSVCETELNSRVSAAYSASQHTEKHNLVFRVLSDLRLR